MASSLSLTSLDATNNIPTPSTRDGGGENGSDAVDGSNNTIGSENNNDSNNNTSMQHHN